MDVRSNRRDMLRLGWPRRRLLVDLLEKGSSITMRSHALNRLAPISHTLLVITFRSPRFDSEINELREPNRDGSKNSLFFHVSGVSSRPAS